MFDWSTILPPKRNDYSGSKFALYFLVFTALIYTFRGCVHYFAPDGGSGSIAGIPLDSYPQGAVQAIINSFGVYGIGHLIQALLVWLVIFRYRALMPFFYVLILMSQVLAIMLFWWKPLPVVPPGQIGVYVLLPVNLGFFLLSIKSPRTQASSSGDVLLNS